MKNLLNIANNSEIIFFNFNKLEDIEKHLKDISPDNICYLYVTNLNVYIIGNYCYEPPFIVFHTFIETDEINTKNSIIPAQSRIYSLFDVTEKQYINFSEESGRPMFLIPPENFDLEASKKNYIFNINVNTAVNFNETNGRYNYFEIENTHLIDQYGIYKTKGLKISNTIEIALHWEWKKKNNRKNNYIKINDNKTHEIVSNIEKDNIKSTYFYSIIRHINNKSRLDFVFNYKEPYIHSINL